MFKSWKLGRIAGIDLYLHPTFLILLALVLISDGGSLAVLFTTAVFGCVLLHELGHALTARAFGISTQDITLSPIGGVARLRRMPRSPGAELLVTLAGPAVNVVIAAVLALGLWTSSAWNPWFAYSLLGRFLSTLMMVNLMLAAFNMIPAFPMDGGRILRALLSGWLGRLRATEIAARIGQVLALAIPFVLLNLGVFSILHLFLAAFVFFAAGRELSQVRAEEQARRRVSPAPSSVSSDGIWTAPPGYRWVSRGNGAWQLAPIVVVNVRPPYVQGNMPPWH